MQRIIRSTPNTQAAAGRMSSTFESCESRDLSFETRASCGTGVFVGGCFLVLDLGDADRERRGASEVARVTGVEHAQGRSLRGLAVRTGLPVRSTGLPRCEGLKRSAKTRAAMRACRLRCRGK